jgi:hypothetical protein
LLSFAFTAGGVGVSKTLLFASPKLVSGTGAPWGGAPAVVGPDEVQPAASAAASNRKTVLFMTWSSLRPW